MPPPAELFRVNQALRPVGDEQEIVNREDVVKGYEYQPGQYVVLEKQEIENIVPKTSRTMEINHFVHLQEIDPLFFERSYYVVPEEAGEKAYLLLLSAMTRTGYCAVANMAMHRREHVLILRPTAEGIVAHTMFYVDEIRTAPSIPTDVGLVPARELELAEVFIKALAGPFEPEKFQDEYRAKLKALIDAKVKGRPVSLAAPARVSPPVIDIMQALKASLEQLPTKKQVSKTVINERPLRKTGAKKRKNRVA